MWHTDHRRLHSNNLAGCRTRSDGMNVELPLVINPVMMLWAKARIRLPGRLIDHHGDVAGKAGVYLNSQ